MGDSVINGGALTDQTALATELATNENTYIGNVSAGSWGPGNLRGWVETYGWLTASKAIFVFSSHDKNDQPTCAPLSPTTHPTKVPNSILMDTFVRYAPKYLPSAIGDPIRASAEIGSVKPRCQPSSRSGLQDIDWLLEESRKSSVEICLIQHTTQKEAASITNEDASQMRAAFANRGLPTINLIDFLKREGEPLSRFYRDDIHLSDAGQAALSKALTACAAVAREPLQ
jgi:hypothetical protein